MENLPANEKQKSVLDISVRNPVTHNTWDKGRYTSYEISVNTSNKSFCLSSSKTRRRYSEFEWLRRTLRNHHPLIAPPQLPPKKYFGDRFDPNFIAFRMKGLEDFLNNLLEEKVFLSDTTMHLFLQTNLSIREMKDYIEGKISATKLDSLWKSNGIKEHCSEFCGLSEKDRGEWTHVIKVDKQKADTPSNEESNNSDISSSFSDDNEENLEYPSLSLLSEKNKGSNLNSEQLVAIMTSESNFQSSHIRGADNSMQTTEPFRDNIDNKDGDLVNYDSKSYHKDIEIDARSITDVDSMAEYVVSNEFSINTIKG